MKKRKIIALSAVTAAILASGFMYSPVMAAQVGQGKKMVSYSATQASELEKAIENNDYATWKGLMKGRGKLAQLINENNFAKYAEAYKLVKEGKYKEANAIRKELGFSNRDSARLGLGNFKQPKVYKASKIIKQKLNNPTK